jgi:putative glutamine amidotransferase
VQAFESDGEGYVLGVQWHPEENREDRRLFAGLVAEASAFRRVSREPSNGVPA